MTMYLIKKEAWEAYAHGENMVITPRYPGPQPAVAEDPNGNIRLAFPYRFWKPEELEEVP